MTVPRHVDHVAHAEFLSAVRNVRGSLKQEAVMAVGGVRVALIDALVDQQRQTEAFGLGAGDVERGVLIQT